MKFNFHSHTIESEGRRFVVFGHGEYPEESVLAGQYARCAVQSFDTLAEAQEAYPKAEVPECSTHLPAWLLSGVSDVAPSWFDEADAGERWDENY